MDIIVRFGTIKTRLLVSHVDWHWWVYNPFDRLDTITRFIVA